MEPNQYILDFPVMQSHSMEDFVIGDCNRVAADYIRTWPDWPWHAVVLVGPAACGKTHLANVWQGRAAALQIEAQALTREMVPELGPAVIVENAERTRDWQALLHLYNWVGANQGHVLMTASTNPAKWDLPLKDLASRLNSTPSLRLTDPDQEILAAVMMKQFSDRQIMVDQAVVSFLLKRMERSFQSVQKIVSRIDRMALEKKTRITIPLAKKVIEQQ